MRWAVLCFWLVAGCAKGGDAALSANTTAPSGVGDAPSGAGADDPLAQAKSGEVRLPSPEELYQGCLSRVEGRGAAGECTVDADCARAGCSAEVCVAAENVKDVMTTCEIRPCFSVLKACGCQAGECTWTIGDAEMNMRKVKLPDRGGGQ